MIRPTCAEALESRVLLSVAVPDFTFGVDGIATADFSPRADAFEDVVVQPDGRIVAVGGDGQDFLVARFNSDGSPDASFGVGGKTTTDFPRNPNFSPGPTGPDRALSVALQPDGKILAAGYHDDGEFSGLEDWAIARYLPDGTPDPQFGSGGVLLFQPNVRYAGIYIEERAYDVALAPDGKIMVAGTTFESFGKNGQVARFNPDGTLDTAYGAGGLAGGIPVKKFQALAVRSDGSAFAVGPGTNFTALAWFSPTGQINPAFGNTGGFGYIGGGMPTFKQLLLYADGSTLAVGSDYSGNDPINGGFLLARFAANGRPDLTFGPERRGVVVTDVTPSRGDAARAATVLSDGRILVAGQSDSAAGFARYASNGVLDIGFGTAGVARLDPDRVAKDQVNAAAFLPDGKVLLAGGLGGAARPAFVGRVVVDSPAPTVSGRHVFYNNSAFDGRNPAATAADLLAVAPDKVALLPTEAATFANVTSYTRGINGVLVDFSATPPARLTADDFEIYSAATASGGAWYPATPRLTVTRLPPDAAAPAATDRYALTWPDGSFRSAWLRVKVKANDWTGLAAPDVFYFGNLVGEYNGNAVDSSPRRFRVDVLDLAATRRAMYSAAPIDSRGDFNRDGRINAFDFAAVRANVGQWVELLPYAQPAAPAPAAPAPSATSDLLKCQEGAG